MYEYIISLQCVLWFILAATTMYEQACRLSTEMHGLKSLQKQVLLIGIILFCIYRIASNKRRGRSFNF